MVELAGAPRWVEGALVYHIYPRSFADSNGDGIGDLQGIADHLDYLQQLNITAIWLSPFYPSPMADFGYDVANYTDVDPIFGTLGDFDGLLAAAHDRGIRVMVDLVPNHTSDEHPWFIESASSRDNDRADWYIWRDPVTHADEPEVRRAPNNWRDALTGGSAWQWHEGRQQFYLHSFDVKQPDLNWTNPAVREAFKEVMRFWLDRGVDGFRVDAVPWLAKEPLMSDDSPNPEYVEGEDLLYHALKHDNSRSWPAVYAYLSEMTEVLHEAPYRERQAFMVTEAYPEGHNPLMEYLSYYVGMDPLVSAPFIFEGLSLPWDATLWRRFLRSFHGALHQIGPQCVASYAFGNHDQPRLASRLGEAVARSAAVLLLTLPGMAFLYYGDEIGMKNVPIPPERVQDPAAKGDPKSGIGRDPERTPMQWSADKSAGFSRSDPTWLPIAEDYTTRNVAAQESDPNSLLSLYKQLARLRSEAPAFQAGSLTVVEGHDPHVLAFVRSAEFGANSQDNARNQQMRTTGADLAGSTKTAARYVTVINFSSEEAVCELAFTGLELVVSTHQSTDQTTVPVRAATSATSELRLKPHEAAVYRAA